MHTSLNNLGSPKDIGDEPAFEATFRDEPVVAGELGEPVDPSTVIFIYRTPDGTETPYEWTVDDEVTNPDPGKYRLAIPPLTQSGRHRVRVKATGGIVAAEEGWFLVNRSNFENP